METLFRLLLFVTLGIILLGANIWFIRTIYKAFFTPNTVIAPFRIIGRDDSEAKLGTSLAYMLQAQLRHIQADMVSSQQSLVETSHSSQEVVVVRSSPGIPFFSSQTLQALTIPTELLQPVNINVEVGGVEVGGILPWLQRFTIQDHTLDFSVYYGEDRAVVVGNLQSIGINETLWLEANDTAPDKIASTVAYAIIKTALSKNQVSEIDALSLDEFQQLLTIMDTTADLNRQAKLGRPAGDAYASVFERIEQFANKMPRWYALVYLAADMAEGSNRPDRALYFYRQLKQIPRDGQTDSGWLDEKIRSLAALTGQTDEIALEKIQADAAYAVDFLNEMFELDLPVPPIVLEKSTLLNAFWDGTAYHTPPQVQFLPDITYHEISYPFIEQENKFKYEGQSGGLLQSYGDVFTSLIKQKRLGQTAETADWIVVPGAIAWINGEDISTASDQSGLRSLKAPGTAYDDPTIGKDPQPAHMNAYVTTVQDNGGVHINSGIPNKAFYETAIRIGSDKAGQIWYAALLKLKPDSQFQDLAKATYEAAVEEFGTEEQDVVRAAWDAVGISVETAEVVSS